MHMPAVAAGGGVMGDERAVLAAELEQLRAEVAAYSQIQSQDQDEGDRGMRGPSKIKVPFLENGTEVE
jgi:hypothetical protein